MLGCRLRVTISDGRLLVGDFMCTDNSRNIILSRTKEYFENRRWLWKYEVHSFNLSLEIRHLGMVVIPGNHVLKIELEKQESMSE